MSGPTGPHGMSVGEKKYMMLYGLMSQVIDLVVNSPDVPADQKFDFIKQLMPAVWWGLMAGKLAPKGSSFETIQALAMKYNAMPCSWEESGEQKVGANATYHRAEEWSNRDLLLKYAPPDCDLVLDLGCGWGHRMFDLWRAGGPQRALYVGGDRPAGSQSCIAGLGKLFPQMDVRGMSFDFSRPDFASLPATARKVLVYSTQAIEQVGTLGPMLFDALLRKFPDAQILGVHQEPISFQMPDWETKNPVRFARDSEYARNKDFNQDLYAQVVGHPELELLDAVPGVIWGRQFPGPCWYGAPGARPDSCPACQSMRSKNAAMA